jgi:hypothetical protein
MIDKNHGLNIFYTYDLDLVNFLVSKGHGYLTRARHIKSNKIFAQFLVNETMQKHINEFNSNKK